MPLGTILDLDTVIQFSDNETTEYLEIIRTVAGEDYLIFSDGTDHHLKFKKNAVIAGLTDLILSKPMYIKLGEGGADNTLWILSKTEDRVMSFEGTIIWAWVDMLAANNVDIGSIAQPFKDTIINGSHRIYEPIGMTEFSTVSRSVDYLILDAGAGATGVLIEDGNLSFVAANKGRLVDDGVSLAMLYGVGPDLGIAIGTCSAGTFHIDLQSDGVVETTTEQFAITDGAFAFPNVTFLSVLATLRTSGDCAQIVGDVTSLTTGRLLSIYNDASGGPGGTPVFYMDKLGKIFIGNSTGVEFGNIERTLTHYIFDTGASASLSIRINGTPVIFDDGVSELALGHTTLAPKLPVLTTAQRNALTATTGMIVWHTGPPARAEIYSGAAWVAL